MTDTELKISETIDGQPLDGRPSPARTAARTRGADTKSPAAPNRPDKYIWGIYIILLFVSVIEVYSASSTEVKTENVYQPLWGHIKFLVCGVGVAWLCQKIHYKFYRWLAMPVAIVCLGLVIYASNFGVRLNDAMRAIPVGSFTLQPAEMMKLALVMLLARIMAKHQMAGGVTTRGVVISAIAVGVMCGSVLQNGFTNMALMMVVSLSMFVIGGTQWRKILIVMGCYALFACAGYIFKESRSKQNDFDIAAAQVEMQQNGATAADDNGIDRSDMRKGRIKMWLAGVHPGDTVTDENYQVKHAHYAMAHGGIRGQMPGNSRESSRLPLAFSDYIYSIIVEDTGLIGGLLLLFVYILLVVRAGVVASKCSRAFPALLIMGCAVMITAQALVHMGIVTGVFPVSGQPLPLISKGGTSIIVMSAAFGMMLSVSRFAVRSGDKKAIRAELRDLPADMQSANPLQLQQ